MSVKEGTRGDRVKLISTSDAWTNLKPGDEGVITCVDGMGTRHCRWNNGSSLGLVPDVDRWVVLEPQPQSDPSTH